MYNPHRRVRCIARTKKRTKFTLCSDQSQAHDKQPLTGPSRSAAIFSHAAPPTATATRTLQAAGKPTPRTFPHENLLSASPPHSSTSLKTAYAPPLPPCSASPPSPNPSTTRLCPSPSLAYPNPIRSALGRATLNPKKRHSMVSHSLSTACGRSCRIGRFLEVYEV